MNKPLFVVEGKDDFSKLKSLGLSYIVKTEGKFIRREFIEFLKSASLRRRIVLVFDPDNPGMAIRERVKKEVKNTEDVNLLKFMSSGNKKIGVAEADFTYLKKIMGKYIKEEKESEERESITLNDLLDFGLMLEGWNLKKEKIRKKYCVYGKSNKTFLDQLNILCIDKNDIKELLDNE